MLNAMTAKQVVFWMLGAAMLLGPWSRARAADPFASNNGLYPTTAEWSGPYRTSNYVYPAEATNGWQGRTRDRLTPANARAYVDALKAYAEPTLEAMIDDPDRWQPGTDWFSMPWTAELQGTDSTSGRDAILGSFSGQVIQGSSFTLAAGVGRRPVFDGLVKDMQNHTVIYYDPVAATMLRRVWADPFNPDARQASFPEGSIVVKAGAVTATPEDWPVVTGSAPWHVFRPPFKSVGSTETADRPLVTPLRVLQFDMIVKDSRASPDTGWVFVTWVYDRDAPGARPWDRLVPLGAQWGNDPEFAGNRSGAGPSGELKETWINPGAPDYARKTLGWGGRLSGPIDVALRHQVVLTDGQVPKEGERASSCMSCHGTSQYPFVANLYPSPNRIFPQDGLAFLLYVPGSPEWAQWYQNRPGRVAQSANKDQAAVGLDYDMLLTFALSNFNNATGHPERALPRFRVH